MSDLDDLRTEVDACDPRGVTAQGTDLELQFIGVNPHINQDMKFAVTVGEERKVESLFVLSTLNDPNLHLVVPKLLPQGPSELGFWADGLEPGFDPINEDGDPNDHQWTRPVCPDGRLTFTHDTPFQDVQGAIATGAIFEFTIPESIRRPELFDNFEMWVRATQLAPGDASKELQTRAYFRWSPYVEDATGAVPEQREPPELFRVGGGIVGESLGAIDQLSLYRVEFVIDVDQSGDVSGDDFVCEWREQAPDGSTWVFEPDLSRCDAPDGFNPMTFEL